ncbi:hypothetical protein B0H16DRAFT_1707048 [Mycena metata]|uniref:Uncharacterized protein n=1 Tax=Mycena metata TaxID=1033252 RepID=A0AAD7DM65_9AGAR|nr:hypothetical protein B0H16DRAFT_1707048 [Mycena metata]
MGEVVASTAQVRLWFGESQQPIAQNQRQLISGRKGQFADGDNPGEMGEGAEDSFQFGTWSDAVEIRFEEPRVTLVFFKCETLSPTQGTSEAKLRPENSKGLSPSPSPTRPDPNQGPTRAQGRAQDFSEPPTLGFGLEGPMAKLRLGVGGSKPA